MSDLITSLQPRNKFILFTFPSGVWSDTVSEKTGWGFEFQDSTANTKQPPRWVLVHAVADEVNRPYSEASHIKPGDMILIEALMFTEHQVYEDQRIWWTSSDKVMAVQRNSDPS